MARREDQLKRVDALTNRYYVLINHFLPITRQKVLDSLSKPDRMMHDRAVQDPDSLNPSERQKYTGWIDRAIMLANDEVKKHVYRR